MKINGPKSGILWCLLAGILCVNTAHFMSIPFLSLYLAHKAHCALWVSGFAVGIGPFFSLVGGFWGGQLSDRYGRLTLLYLSLFLTAGIFILFYGVFSLENNLLQWVLIVVLNALFGLFTSFFQPSVMALLSDWVEPSYREQVFQFRYAALNMGAIIGPLLGVFLGLTLSPLAFLIGGMIYLGYGVVLYGVLKTQKALQAPSSLKLTTVTDSIQMVFSDKRLLYFILFHLVFAVCYAQITSTLAFCIEHNVPDGSRVYSFVIALNAVGVILGQAPVYYFCKNRAKNKMILYGCFIFCLGCFGFAYSGAQALYFYGSTLLITLGELLIFPYASGFIDAMAPAHLKGTYFGALTFRELGLALGPVLGSILLQTFGTEVLFIFIGVLALSSYYFMVRYQHADQPVLHSKMSLDEGVSL